MGFKQALFLGGVVMVLAACSDSTAPTSAMRKGGVSASAKADTTTTTNGPTVRSMSTTTDCKSGWLQMSGRTDSVCVDEIQ